MHPISCCLLPCHWPYVCRFPRRRGLALVLGVFINYFSVPKGDATVLFSGVFLIVLAIIFNGMASGKVAKGGTDQAMRKKGIIIAVCAGILMAFFYRFVAAAMDLETWKRRLRV